MTNTDGDHRVREIIGKIDSKGSVQEVVLFGNNESALNRINDTRLKIDDCAFHSGCVLCSSKSRRYSLLALNPGCNERLIS